MLALNDVSSDKAAIENEQQPVQDFRHAVGRVVEVFARKHQRGAAAAQKSLDRITRGFDQRDDWTSSVLTGTGFPVEFSFGYESGALRYSSEVAPRPANLRLRLPAARDALRDLEGSLHFDPDVLATISRHQRDKALRYGAWLSGRHADAGSTFKLYAEARDWSQRAVREFASLTGVRCNPRESGLRMIGIDPGTGACELYYGQVRATPAELDNVLIRCGFPERCSSLREQLSCVWRRSVNAELPGPRVGYSYAFAADGRVSAVSVFFLARSVFGGDGRIRRGVLDYARQAGIDLTDYAEVSEPLQSRSSCKTVHGFFGFIIKPESAFGLHIDLAPPVV